LFFFFGGWAWVFLAPSGWVKYFCVEKNFFWRPPLPAFTCALCGGGFFRKAEIWRGGPVFGGGFFWGQGLFNAKKKTKRWGVEWPVWTFRSWFPTPGGTSLGNKHFFPFFPGANKAVLLVFFPPPPPVSRPNNLFLGGPLFFFCFFEPFWDFFFQETVYVFFRFI